MKKWLDLEKIRVLKLWKEEKFRLACLFFSNEQNKLNNMNELENKKEIIIKQIQIIKEKDLEIKELNEMLEQLLSDFNEQREDFEEEIATLKEKPQEIHNHYYYNYYYSNPINNSISYQPPYFVTCYSTNSNCCLGIPNTL